MKQPPEPSPDSENKTIFVPNWKLTLKGMLHVLVVV